MKAILATCVTGLILVGTTFADTHSSSPMHGGMHGGGSTSGHQSQHQGSHSQGSHSGTMVASNQHGASQGAVRFHNTHKFDQNYHLTHGRSFQYGYYYPGRNHYQWSAYCWWSRYNCYTYWCPSTSCYYYWSEPASCYYPVSYAEVVAPTASTQLLDINVNNTNTNTNTNVVTTAPTYASTPTYASAPTYAPPTYAPASTYPATTPVGPPSQSGRVVVHSTVGNELPPPPTE